MSTPADFSVLNSLSNFLTSCADISNKEAGIVDFLYALHWHDLQSDKFYDRRLYCHQLSNFALQY